MTSSSHQVAAVMAEIDTDGGGDIDIGEFTAWFIKSLSRHPV
jgi:hypothetical protein